MKSKLAGYEMQQLAVSVSSRIDLVFPGPYILRSLCSHIHIFACLCVHRVLCTLCYFPISLCFQIPLGSVYIQLPALPGFYVPQSLYSHGSIYLGTYIPSFLGSQVPIFPSPYFPRVMFTQDPRFLRSQVHLLTCSRVPRILFPGPYFPISLCFQVPVFPDL